MSTTKVDSDQANKLRKRNVPSFTEPIDMELSNTWTGPTVHPITMNTMFLKFTGILLPRNTASCFFL